MISAEAHIVAGWIAMLCGVLSGAAIGLFFHRDDWAGGYGSFRRRMLRLGHIAFFGLGLINVGYGLTRGAIALPETHAFLSSLGFLVGLVTMPLCCFLTAWKKPFRHAFPVPVLGVAVGIAFLLLGWPTS